MTSTIGSTDRAHAIQEALARYLKHLSGARKKRPLQERLLSSEGLTVILTGSTGSLGSYLLHELLLSQRVVRVICLNRRLDAAGYQRKISEERGLDIRWEHVTFLQVDLAKPKLGLDEDVYESLREEANAVIHNQWPVNFNLGLEAFEPHIEGILNLIRLSATSTHTLPIFFVSSLATAGRWLVHHPGTTVPEAALTDPALSLDMGYAESKWISEALLHHARESCGVSASIWRVGQIAGPVHESNKVGMWNKKEVIPSIIAMGLRLGFVLRSAPVFDDARWIPVNTIARILVELLDNDSRHPSTFTHYYGIENPRAACWADLASAISDYYTSMKGYQKIKMVSRNKAWEILKAASMPGSHGMEGNLVYSTVELLGKIRELDPFPSMDVERTINASQTMRTLEPVNTRWMRLWLEQWNRPKSAL